METLVPTGSGSRNLLQSDTTHCIISPYRYFGVKTQQNLSLMEAMSLLLMKQLWGQR
jgi:hypothetical protein